MTTLNEPSSTRLHEALSKLLVEKLKKYSDPSQPATLTKATCTCIYCDIFEALTDVFKTSKAQFTNEAANWIAQYYYDCVSINETQDLDPNIFDVLLALGL